MLNEPFMINPVSKKRKVRKIKLVKKVRPIIIPKPIIVKVKKRKIKKERKVKKIMSKSHRLTVYKAKRGVKISPKARLVHKYRGHIINPLDSIGELALFNPRHRRHIMRYKHNPLGVATNKLMGFSVVDTLPDVVACLGGFAGAKIIPSFIPVPVSWKVGIQGTAVKLATVLVLTIGANKLLGSKVAKAVFVGGLVAVGSELLGDILVKAGLPLSEAISLGATITPQDLSASLNQQVY